MQTALLMMILAADPVGWDISGTWVLERADGSCDANHPALGQNTLEFRRVSVERGMDNNFSYTEMTYEGTYSSVHVFADDPCTPRIPACFTRSLPRVVCSVQTAPYDFTGKLRRYDETRMGSRTRDRFEIYMEGELRAGYPYTAAGGFTIGNTGIGSSVRFEPFIDPSGFRMQLRANVGNAGQGVAPDGCDGGYYVRPDANCGMIGNIIRTFVRGQPTDGFFPKGTVSGALRSAADNSPIPSATVTLFELSERIRTKRANETDDAYDLYVAEVLARSTRIADTAVDGMGGFSFEQIPIFTSRVRSTRAPYAVVAQTARQIRMENAEAIDVFFAPAVAPNVLVGQPVTLSLSEVTELIEKSRFINKLSRLGPVQYGPVEVAATNHLQSLAAGSGPTDAQLEGVKRAVWAERAVYDGASYAQSGLRELINTFADLAAALVKKLVSTGDAKTKEAKKKLSELTDMRANALVGRGFSKINPPNLGEIRGKIDALYKSNAGLQKAFAAKWLKKFLKYGVFDPWVRRTQDPRDKAIIGKLASVTSALIDLSITKEAGAISALLVKEAIKALADEFFDNRFEDLSFTGQTKDLLEFSNAQMIGWRVDDRDAYLADVTAVNITLQDLYAFSAQHQQKLEYIKATSKTLSTFGEVVSFLPDNPYTSSAETAAKVGGLTASFSSLGSAVDLVFLQIPKRMDAAVYGAYGMTPPMQNIVTSAPVDPDVSVVTAAGAEVERVRTVRLEALRTAVMDDDFPAALDLFDPAETAALDIQLDRVNALYRAVVDPVGGDGYFHAQQLSHANTVNEVRFGLSALEDQFLALLFEVIGDPNAGADAPVYLAQRQALLKAIQGMQETLVKLELQIDDIEAEMGVKQVYSSASVERLTIVSNSTQQAMLQAPGEVFTVTAVVRNLTLAPIDLAATASITANTGYTLNAALAPSATLAAQAERTITWTLTHDGGPLDASPFAAVRVDLTEPDGSPAAAFFGQSTTAFIEVDLEQTDTDDDLLNDRFERRFGLDVGTDDAAGDLDSDGLSNLREQRLGTDPSRADSDGDGLDDLEEVTVGADGVVTDPRNPDSDGDGADDGADPYPASLFDEPAPRDEPAVSVAGASMVLTSAQPNLQVPISNGGAGSLVWSAFSSRPSLVQVADAFPAASTGDELALSLAPGFESADAVPVTITVVDLSGSETDNVQFVVMVGGDGKGSTDGGVGADAGVGTDGSVGADGGPGADAGVADGGSGPGGEESSSGCRQSNAAIAPWLLLGLLIVWRRRRPGTP